MDQYIAKKAVAVASGCDVAAALAPGSRFVCSEDVGVIGGSGMIKLTRKHVVSPDLVAIELEYQKRLAEVCVCVCMCFTRFLPGISGSVGTAIGNQRPHHDDHASNRTGAYLTINSWAWTYPRVQPCT